MTTEIDNIDLGRLRWIASNLQSCFYILPVAGATLRTIIATIDLGRSRRPEERAPDHDDYMARLNELLQSAWADMFDVLDMPRRPLPRITPTRH